MSRAFDTEEPDDWEKPFQPYEEAGLEPLRPTQLGIVALARLAMDVAKFTESPIETILGVSLIARLTQVYGDRAHWCSASAAHMVPPGHVAIVAQLPWKNYRADWAILIDGQPAVVVECDGREFHSSAEQISRDTSRDFAMLDAGIEVFRFSGSEIHRSSEHCAKLVCRIIEHRVRP